MVLINFKFYFYLGPDSGVLTGSKKWKATTPTSFKSPYFAQGDLGFISLNKKRYGTFFLAVQTFTGHLFVMPIKNQTSASLIQAVQSMKKV